MTSRTCLDCSTPIPSGSRFCPGCGTALAISASPDRPTVEVPGPGAAPDAAGSRTPGPAASSPRDGSRFAGGTLIAGRYRVVGQLGRGGMGEVYRADDLELGESVALKFLSPALATDPERLTRLREEVRVARQVTHPHVCRVHDLVTAEGQTFLSMEYIDGEDLASLLRRIGRFPPDKALQIARQLCVGLAAAHERDVIHRDLKPANIMIDGRGQVRIMDFGLSGLLGGDREVVEGTPAYMAPEQLFGRGTSPRSDIYSLGLVLYEVFTGTPAISEERIADIVSLHETDSIRTPSSHLDDLDPLVERVILRCLEEDPARRPHSALAVAAALPGGDPLAVALAAGEIPSPELIAATGGRGGLRAPAGLALGAILVLGVILVAFGADRLYLLQRSEVPLPPEVLAHRAREIASDLGYGKEPADREYGFQNRVSLVQALRENDASPERWRRFEGNSDVLRFWYRESPEPLVTDDPKGRVWYLDPPLDRSGMVNITLSAGGELRELRAWPSYRLTPDRGVRREPEWTKALSAAGLDPAELATSVPRIRPLAPSESLTAWAGEHPQVEGVTLLIDAASLEGRIVSFNVLESWSPRQKSHDAPAAGIIPPSVIRYSTFVLSCVALFGGAFFGWRNLSRRRGDRRGALTVALFYVGGSLLVWLLRAHHVFDTRELQLFIQAFSTSLFQGVLAGFFYIALEPTVRRVGPERLVGWSRLLDGGFRDPRFGREILVGLAVGASLVLLQQLHHLTATKLGPVPPPPWLVDTDFLLGPGMLVAKVIFTVVDSVSTALLATFIFVVILAGCRKIWITALLLFVIGMIRVPVAVATDLVWLDLIFRGVSIAALAAVLLRGGLVTLATTFFIYDLLLDGVFTLDREAWYFGNSLFLTAVVLGLGGYALTISLTGKSKHAVDAARYSSERLSPGASGP